jgi:hypothetical protein
MVRMLTLSACSILQCVLLQDKWSDKRNLAISKNVLNFVSTGSKNTFQRSAEKCENFYLYYAEI